MNNYSRMPMLILVMEIMSTTYHADGGRQYSLVVKLLMTLYYVEEHRTSCP